MPIRRSPNDARHPIHRVVAITRNRWSRSIGMTGRNQSERLVAIIRYAQSWVRMLRNPLILDGSVDGVERSLFEQHLPETLHKGSQALFRHHRD